MDAWTRLNRRCFLSSGVAFGAAPFAASVRVQNETVYHFATRECDIRMSVEFYDRYSSQGFWFRERRTDARYCLSPDGEKGRACLPNFSGSIAIAQYRIRSRSNSSNLLVLRERVRSIDRDNRVNERPPFERTLDLQGGLASDVQAFGYVPDASSPDQAGAAQAHEPWCLFRQDLYLDAAGSPFLVVHWKHTLSAIRILDVIPGDQTQIVDGGKKKESG
ncbi:MAG TPA: hypothetical protein VH601_04855 [Bryobacteraceae bacterium]